MSLEKLELKLLLTVLAEKPELSTYIVESIIDELEEASLFDVFEQKLTEEGCRVLHTLTT